jgi:UDP-2,3-diacylglucosamine hydrolase
MHGDTLCTDDIAYQKYRAKARNPFIQKPLLMLSVKRRLKIAEGLRNKSKSAIQEKTEDIMDVNQQTVEQVMSKHNINLLIHGHTHRPAEHEFNLNGNSCKRIVLGDWYEHGSVLRCTPETISLENLDS